MKPRNSPILAFVIAILAAVSSLQTASAQQEPLLSCSDTNNILHGRTKKVADHILSTLRLSNCLQLTDASQLTAITNLGIGGLTSLQTNDFAGLSNLQTLRIRNSPDLITLPSGLLNNLTNLQDLMVDNFSVSALPSGLLDDLHKLQTLQLSSNADLTTVPSGLFNNLTNLTRLNLSNTPQLASLPSGIFDNLAKLTRLDLETGQLTSLTNGLFNNLTNLTWLDVSGHRLASLPSGAFDNLAKLAILSLNNNRLPSLTAGVFDNLTKLQWLAISGNRLTFLRDHVFDNLPILRTLHLSRNPDLTSLPPGVFDKLTELEYLYIENLHTTTNVGLTSLSANVFSKTTKLKQLDISGNQFTSLPATVFDNLVNLDFLDLRSNGLTTLPLSEGIFDDLVSLNRHDLYLTGNPVYTNLLTNTLSVTIIPSTMEVVEGDSGTKNANFQVLLGRGILTNSIAIHYATRDGTATEADNDYTPTSGQWRFAGDWRQGQSFSGQWLRENILNLSIPIRGDEVEEEDETFELVLTRSSRYDTAGQEFAAEVTIVDNDALPEVELSLPVTSFSVAEGDSGTTVIGFHIQLTQSPNAEVSIAYTTDDGTATAGEDYIATDGTLTFDEGTTDLTQTISISIRGDTEEEADETFHVRLSNPRNVHFGGGDSMRQTIETTITIADDDVLPPPPPSLFLTPSVVEITEGDGGAGGETNAEFQVRLTRVPSQTVTLNYATQDVTATAGQDYTAARGGIITFAAGTTDLTQTISVPILDDTLDEPNETFTLTLSNPVNARLLAATARCTILDDDAPLPVIAWEQNQAQVTEGAETIRLAVNIINNVIPNEDITIAYDTRDDTAFAGQDYDETSGTLTFLAGTTTLTQTISVRILDDAINEPLETFDLILSSPVNAVFPNGAPQLSATITIVDEDAPPPIVQRPLVIGFAQTFLSFPEGDEDTTDVEIPVQLLLSEGEALHQAVSIDYATQGGTAVADQDYTSTSGTLTFAEGATDLTQTIAVSIRGDPEEEADETFTITLRNPTNAVVHPHSAQVQITDDDEPLPPSRGGNPSPAQPSFPGGRFPLLIFNTSELSLTQGGSALYQVRGVSARSPFVSDMIVRIRPSHPQVMVDPQKLIFTTTTWLNFQTIKVSATDNAAAIGEPVSIGHSIDASEGFVAHPNAGMLSVIISSTAAAAKTGELGSELSSGGTVIEPQLVDYDADDDGLIEISNLAQLNAIRWDLDGDGQPDQEAFADAYHQAFPSAIDNMGIPNNAPAQGYELTSDLDFDTNHNGHAEEADAFWNKGHGWQSIGLFSHPFQAVLKGNEHKIVGLFQDQSDASRFAGKPSGLFGAIGNRGQVVGLGLEEVDIKGVNWVGAIAGLSQGSISHCSVSGQVVGSNSVGGLVGHNFGNIAHSFVNAEVSGVIGVSVFVGWNVGGSIESSSAQGRVNGATSAGDLVGLGTPAR